MNPNNQMNLEKLPVPKTVGEIEIKNPVGKKYKKRESYKKPHKKTQNVTDNQSALGSSFQEIAKKEIKKTLTTKEKNAVEKKGVEEGVKEDIKKRIETKAKLDELLNAASRPIYKLKAVFPFQLFPDSITIEETRVVFIFREFFKSEQIRSLSIDEIMEVTIQTIPFFASLKVITQRFNPTNTEPLQITFLKRGEAIKARRIIEGLKIAKYEKLDLVRLTSEELLVKLQELGRIQEVT